MKIEERLLRSIDAASSGDLLGGWNLILPALEATARKYFGKAKISQREFKAFVRDYYWLIEQFGGGGINLEETRFPRLVVKSDNDRVLDEPDFADLLYHIHRCSLAHGHELGWEFQFIPTVEAGRHNWMIKLDGSVLQMPETMLWAMVALVLLCRANVGVFTDSSVWLTWGGGPVRNGGEPYRLDVDLFWGAEDVLRVFFEARPGVRVKMDFADRP